MKKNITTKIMLSAAIIFASIATVSAQSSNDNTAYDQPQSAYQDQRVEQKRPAQQDQYSQQQYTQPSQQPVQQDQQYIQSQPAPTNQYYNNQQSFYYYPGANVYYDPTYNHYMYNNGSAWLTVNALPFNIRIGGLPRVMVYHRGPQVWLDNRFHRGGYYYGNNYGFHQPVVAYRDNFRGGGGFNRGFDAGRGRGFEGGRSFGGGRGGFGHRR